MRNLKATSALASKVPLVTGVFWLAKILTTGMGETTSDFFVKSFDPVIAVLTGGVVLGLVLLAQVLAKSYAPWLYWSAVVMVSIVGTMAADVLHVQFGISYQVSTIGFAIALAGVFALWYLTERSLSIHNIRTRRQELFYWATVLTTFALGTAAGDLTANTLKLGYLASGILFAVVIAIPAIGYWHFGLNATVAFWFAYIVTRPLGASFADWFAVSPERGGLALGTGPISLALLAAIAVSVAFMSRRVELISGQQ